MSKSTGKVAANLAEMERKINESSAQDRAYAAGLFDGEGCVAVYYRVIDRQLTTSARIANTDPRPLEWMVETFGGKITWRGGVRRGKRKETYNWYLMNARALAFFTAIRPYVHIKGEQMDLAAELAGTSARGRRISPAVHEQRIAIAAEIKALKRKVIGLRLVA